MTVAELIEKLKEMPPETNVQMEGSEWPHDVTDVNLIPKGSRVDPRDRDGKFFIPPENENAGVVYLRSST